MTTTTTIYEPIQNMKFNIIAIENILKSCQIEQTKLEQEKDNLHLDISILKYEKQELTKSIEQAKNELQTFKKYEKQQQQQNQKQEKNNDFDLISTMTDETPTPTEANNDTNNNNNNGNKAKRSQQNQQTIFDFGKMEQTGNSKIDTKTIVTKSTTTSSTTKQTKKANRNAKWYRCQTKKWRRMIRSNRLQSIHLI